MQLTFSSDEPLETVLAVVSAVYGVEVAAKEPRHAEPLVLGDVGDGSDERITRPRPT